MERALAGQDLTLERVPLPQEAGPQEAPLERLRAFKDLLNAALAELNAGRPRACVRCAIPLPSEDLDELPWADRCRDASTCGLGEPR